MALPPQELSVAQPGATSTTGERAAPARRFRIRRVVASIIVGVLVGALVLIVGFFIMYVGTLAGYTPGAMIGGGTPGDHLPFEGGGTAGIVGAIIGIFRNIIAEAGVAPKAA